MPEEKTEIAEGLSKADLAWIEEEDKKMDETEKKIASGEIPQSFIAGWTSENWQRKASGAAPDDMDV